MSWERTQIGTLFSSITLALYTLVSTRGATGGETLTRFPTSTLGTEERDLEDTAAAVVRSGVFEYSIRRIRILKKWKNSIRIRIGKLEFDSHEL
jgi:hypothetical protein